MSIPGIEMSPGARWERAMNLLEEARNIAPSMKDYALPGPVRDRAVESYVTAVDSLVAELGHLRETGALEEVDDYLRTIWRAN